ncbi:MAG: hypothetical protein KCHDKBKB_00541 [Elusimicrobia bacterium]|nr:hypothetical protein [Elusimicrobiota bacterium]
MAETVGSLVDKISIIELKIFHMQKQIDRKDASPDHRMKCVSRLEIMHEQRNDLVSELSDLFDAVLLGQKKMKVYRQFKMYNDPAYRAS